MKAAKDAAQARTRGIDQFVIEWGVYADGGAMGDGLGEVFEIRIINIDWVPLPEPPELPPMVMVNPPF
jgi:hypothetical protein